MKQSNIEALDGIEKELRRVALICQVQNDHEIADEMDNTADQIHDIIASEKEAGDIEDGIPGARGDGTYMFDVEPEAKEAGELGGGWEWVKRIVTAYHNERGFPSEADEIEAAEEALAALSQPPEWTTEDPTENGHYAVECSCGFVCKHRVDFWDEMLGWVNHFKGTVLRHGPRINTEPERG